MTEVPHWPIRKLDPPNLGGRPRSPAKTLLAFWLQVRLTELRWSNQIFARRAGVSATNIGKWIAGDREPRHATLALLARSLGVTIDWLVRPLPTGLALPCEVSAAIAEQALAFKAPKQERSAGSPQTRKSSQKAYVEEQIEQREEEQTNAPRVSAELRTLEGSDLLRAALGTPVEGGVFDA